MKLLSLKYKMHKLVNLVFYLIIFGIGFILGFSTEKINFNKLISQFLFIDNVNAYTIYDNIDEQFIYDGFTSIFPNFDIEQHPYIYCDNFNSSNFSSNGTYERLTRCYALEKTFLPNFFPYGNTHIYLSNNGTRYSFYYIRYSHNEEKFNESIFFENQDRFGIFLSTNSSYLEHTFYTNFDFKELTEEENSQYNVLDFSKFMSSSCDDCNNGTNNENTGGDNENTGGDNDNTDEDIEIEVINSSFYEFAQKIFGEVSEENKFIYDFITFGLVTICFTLFVLIVGYIFNKIFGG